MPSPRPAKTSTSPRTNGSHTMDFPDAMREVIAGNKVTKLEWNNPSIVVYLNGRLRINLEDGTHDLLVTEGDMIGTDWVVVKE